MGQFQTSSQIYQIQLYLCSYAGKFIDDEAERSALCVQVIRLRWQETTSLTVELCLLLLKALAITFIAVSKYSTSVASKRGSPWPRLTGCQSTVNNSTNMACLGYPDILPKQTFVFGVVPTTHTLWHSFTLKAIAFIPTCQVRMRIV